MNKKAYITPAMEVMNVEAVEMIAASSLSMYGADEDAVDTSADGGQLGRGRRGSWGNLWNE